MNRALTAALLSLLVLLGVALGNPAARLNGHAPHAQAQAHTQGEGTPLRQAVMTAAGQSAMAALRPALKKMGHKGTAGALPLAGVVFTTLDTPGGLAPERRSPRWPEPAPHGYLARAPPAQA